MILQCYEMFRVKDFHACVYDLSSGWSLLQCLYVCLYLCVYQLVPDLLDNCYPFAHTHTLL